MQNLTCDDIRTNIPPNATLLDVRTQDEFKQGGLPNALNIPLDQIQEIAKKKLNLLNPVLVYCHIGGRADQAVTMLIELGFQNVINIGGVEHYRHCNQLMQNAPENN